MEKQNPYLSICIVTYQACQFLVNCLDSIYKNPPSFFFEIIVVDNHSTDGTVATIHKLYPDIKIITNTKNLGFTIPMNQALRQANGQYLLELNPDTIILPNSLDNLIDFLQKNPEVGICGPKVLNPDGTLQKPCRRGESRPLAVISYFSGLSRLFPKNKSLSEYLMSYCDEDEIHPVAGVAGSCMLIRRKVVDLIGYLDERFFAYQEDADYCFRARQAGWQVYYVPSAQIIHIGGKGGSHVEPYRSIIEWHRAYLRYYQKNLSNNYPLVFNWFYYFAMVMKLVFSLFLHYLKKGRFAKNWNNL